MEGKEPNAGHYAIQEYIAWSQVHGKEPMLVTQNIDDLHEATMPKDLRAGKVEGASDFAFTDHIYELHGNTRYMRCPTFCNKRWFVSKKRAEV